MCTESVVWRAFSCPRDCLLLLLVIFIFLTLVLLCSRLGEHKVAISGKVQQSLGLVQWPLDGSLCISCMALWQLQLPLRSRLSTVSKLITKIHKTWKELHPYEPHKKEVQQPCLAHLIPVGRK